MSVSIHDELRAFSEFVNACLGKISRNMRRIDFAMDDGDKFRCRFVLRKESPEDRVLIQDIQDDFEDFQEYPVKFKVEVVISTERIFHPARELGYWGVFCEKARS